VSFTPLVASSSGRDSGPVTVTTRDDTSRRPRLHWAWVVAAVSFVAILGAAGFRSVPGVMMNPLHHEFGWSHGTVGLAMSVNMTLFGLTAPFAAALMDRLGVRPVLSAALVLVVGLPLLVFALRGFPLAFFYPQAGRFNITGGVEVLPEFAALLFGLTIYTAAFIAEVVRAGILAVSRGQIEAAYSLGLRPRPTLRLVVVPQAMRVIIPPLTSQYLNLTKNSTLAVAIGYPDLVQVFTGTVLNQTGQAVEVVAITMLVYLTISLVTSFAMNIYNRRVALVER
jgi:ABC-type amino acid transport system permease subunit